MNFDEARTELASNYVSCKLEVKDCDRYLVVSRGPLDFEVTEEDITDYANTQEVRALLQFKPNECSICGKNYREQPVSLLNEYMDRYLSIPYGRHEIIFGESSNEGLYVTIGGATNLYKNVFRFQDTYLQLCLERFRMPMTQDRVRAAKDKGKERVDIRDFMFSPTTIRVHNVSKHSVDDALNYSSLIIEKCLFELSYLKGIPMGVVESWPQPRVVRHRTRREPFEFGEQVQGNCLPLREATFNPDVIKFYQRALAADDPAIQFLSYYQVMEYYFLKVSEERLYEALARRINDSKFSTKPEYLDRIIQDVDKFKSKLDETSMLKEVLEKYIDEGDIIAFVRAYEKYLSEPL